MAASSSKPAALVISCFLLALILGGPAPAESQQPPCSGPQTWKAACNMVSGAIGSVLSPSPSAKPKPAPTGAGLSVGHYNQAGSLCPTAEQTVRTFVEAAINKNRTIGASLIRLHFHDCFVRGCDASVLLNTTASGNTDTELTGLPNANSLRGFEVIDAIKEVLENKTAGSKDACPGVVSCADVLALAARDASDILSNGNITYQVPTGRLDGVKSVASETGQLPGPGSDITQLNTSFTNQGLNLADAVTLSAAHSIGRVRCRFTRDQPAMDATYKANLAAICGAPGAGADDKLVNQDLKTPDVLDIKYYENIDKFVLFPSDAALISIDETKKQVDANIADPVKFAKDFAAAMVKMGNITGVFTANSAGEIRKQCWKVNGK